MFGSGNKNTDTKVSGSTLISRQAEIIGDLRFNGELIVEGRIKGNIYADDESGALVRVAESGVIEGEIWVPSVVVNGLVKGDIHSSQHLELAAKAVVMGNVFYKLIEMVMGSEVNGSLLQLARAQQDAKRLAGGESRALAWETAKRSDESADADDETIVD
ncbi:MAG: polymer-forming cytoskeletal protein [Gammaproteobacteria bacterium]|nr:polymer-forming cytoskeletal protein [Pseudomonadales bacterium]MCP5331706.1 polymer-forming cytoskeletal protein [Pseudomonadales bacterium]